MNIQIKLFDLFSGCQEEQLKSIWFIYKGKKLTELETQL